MNEQTAPANATSTRTLTARGLVWRGSYEHFEALATEAELWMQQDWDSARTIHEERLADELAQYPVTPGEVDDRRQFSNMLNREDAKNWARLRWELDGPQDKVRVQARESRDTELTLTGTAEEVAHSLRDSGAIPVSIDLRGRLDVTKRILIEFDEATGCSLQVTSGDRDWRNRAFEALEKQMRVSQPGWRWLSGPVGILLRLLVTLLILLALIPVTRALLPEVVHSAVAYYLGLGLIIGALVFFFFEWLAPRFLVTDNGRTRVRVTVASVSAALIIGFLGGLVVSFMPLWA
ncbi:hypothetical protein [Gulosibacter molinativorax]|uniref:Uncharacterized protein n=1 Tax=Gulosibacter molinativorax TaxID=256821 RepID=A0ABT7C3E5_9MICO|nr:hypothetical protein [Gulosibacter molinativorax]MDJ1369791.1 hypothetical protein [Gulosibacter molinativorax]QUY61756.1 Hypotetical protein [Gulosibacter molinativorax]